MKRQTNPSRRINYVIAAILVCLTFAAYVVKPTVAGAEASKTAKYISRRNASLPFAKGLPAALAPMMMMMQSPTYSCLPTCASNDGRMLVLAGPGLQTFVGAPVKFTLLSKANSSTIEIGIFDPDSAGSWDVPTTKLKYELILDPAGDGTGTTVIRTWTSDALAAWDNQWYTEVVPNDPAAKVGVFHSYLFKVSPAEAPGASSRNGFKVRTDGRVGSLGPEPALISLMVPLPAGDTVAHQAIYPNGMIGSNYDMKGSTYDGTWTFNLVVPNGATRIEVWDGDFDSGGATYGYDPVTNLPIGPIVAYAPSYDTDDPDTGTSFDCDDGLGGTITRTVPCFVPDSEALAEKAVGVGSPADDNGTLRVRRTLLSTDSGVPADRKYLFGTPGIHYRLISPSGQIFENANPSGSREWEQFLVTSEPGFTAGVTADHTPASIEVGIWQLVIDGLDAHNLVSLRLSNQVLAGTIQIGDFVWNDLNANGVQDDGEPGIPGVLVELLNSGGTVISSTTTDADGNYFFDVEPGTYTTRVAASNFTTGPLVAYTPTVNYDGVAGGDNQRTQIVNTDLFTFDYGYNTAGGAGSGAIGNQVFRDLNGNGTFDTGDVGIAGVTVILTFPDATTQTEITDANGEYQFTGLAAGSYSVTIDTSTLPTGLLKSNGVNPGLDNNSQVTPYLISLADGEDNPTADFGYISGQELCPADGSSTTPGSGGTLYTEILANGDLFVRFSHPRTKNDNAYGTSAQIVGWSVNRGHIFKDLTNSDKTQFRFKNGSGTTVLDFYMDYITAGTGTVSGYKSLGASGGDGSLISGNAAHILSVDSSEAQNLNKFCQPPHSAASGNCVAYGVDLLVNSPPTNADYVLNNPNFAGWKFDMTYEMVISKAAFGGTVPANYKVEIPDAHNSPAKTGENQFTPTTCPTGGGGGGSTCIVTVTNTKLDKKKFEVTLKNTSTSTDAFITGLTLGWPSTNGKLLKVKLGADTIYNGGTGVNSPISLTVSNLIADANKRKIGKNSSKTLTFEFQNNVNKTLSNYTNRTVTIGNTPCTVTY